MNLMGIDGTLPLFHQDDALNCANYTYRESLIPYSMKINQVYPL